MQNVIDEDEDAYLVLIAIEQLAENDEKISNQKIGEEAGLEAQQVRNILLKIRRKTKAVRARFLEEIQ